MPSYITDRRSLRCTSAAVLLNPRGNPPLPIQITLHMAQGSDVASDREHTNPGLQPHSPAQAPSCGLHAMKEYFWMPLTFPNCTPPLLHMLLSFRFLFWGESKERQWLWQVALKGCEHSFIGFWVWTEGSGKSGDESRITNQHHRWGLLIFALQKASDWRYINTISLIQPGQMSRDE